MSFYPKVIAFAVTPFYAMSD